MTNIKKLLEVKNLTMRFGGLVAVDDLSFDVRHKEIVGIIGPNGAGKTTIFNCITQFYKEDEGQILFYEHPEKEDFVDLNDLKVTEVIDRGLVRTFQNLELVKDLSIIDNVLIGGHNQFKTNIIQHILHTKKSKKEENAMYEKAMEILRILKLDHLKDSYVFGQPYGVLKKIEIARTLLCNPKLIILDEPAAGLNDSETNELRELISEIKNKFDCSVILIEHDMSFVMNICDRICAISFGKFLAMDIPSVIQQNSLVQEAYLGGEDDE